MIQSKSHFSNNILYHTQLNKNYFHYFATWLKILCQIKSKRNNNNNNNSFNRYLKSFLTNEDMVVYFPSVIYFINWNSPVWRKFQSPLFIMGQVSQGLHSPAK